MKNQLQDKKSIGGIPPEKAKEFYTRVGETNPIQKKQIEDIAQILKGISVQDACITLYRTIDFIKSNTTV